MFDNPVLIIQIVIIIAVAIFIISKIKTIKSVFSAQKPKSSEDISNKVDDLLSKYNSEQDKENENPS